MLMVGYINFQANQGFQHGLGLTKHTRKRSATVSGAGRSL